MQINFARALSAPLWAEMESLFALLQAGPPPRPTIKFVGGLVRDQLYQNLFSRPASSHNDQKLDIDMAIAGLDYSQLVACFDGAPFTLDQAGKGHASLHVEGQFGDYDITILRQDVETNGRFARVDILPDGPESWLMDSVRRDFTINAIYADIDGTLYDPQGGLADLKAGKVRFIGDAQTRLDEDILRLIRYYRFFGLFGAGKPDAQIGALAAKMAPALMRLSARRLGREFAKFAKSGPRGQLGLDLLGAAIGAQTLTALHEKAHKATRG